MKPVKAFDRVFHFLVEKLRIAEIRDSHGIAGFSFYKDTCTFPLLDSMMNFPPTHTQIHLHVWQIYFLSHFTIITVGWKKRCRIM